MKTRFSAHLIHILIKVSDRMRRAGLLALLSVMLLVLGSVFVTSSTSAGVWVWKTMSRLFGPLGESSHRIGNLVRPMDTPNGGNYTIVPINVSAAGTSAMEGAVAIGINARGDIVGMYSNQVTVFHGFVRTADGTVTTFDAPHAGSGPAQGTVPLGINASGVITGISIDANRNNHGFVRGVDGTITEFDVPAADLAANRGTVAIGINDSGCVVGYYTVGYWASTTYHGFLRASDGTITTIDAPDAGTTSEYGMKLGTQAYAVNSSGVIAGIYMDARENTHGFLRAANGTFTEFDPPGTVTMPSGSSVDITGTSPVSIDSAGDIVGTYTGANYVRHGFLRAANGTFTVIDPPSAAANSSPLPNGTMAMGIDPGGKFISGGFSDASGAIHGFLRASDGAYTVFDAPGAATTMPYFPGTGGIGVNGSGNVAGFYTDENNVIHAILMVPTAMFQVPPSITSAASATFTVGMAGSFTVHAMGTPAPTLSESGPLPAGVIFNGATGALSGTPSAGTAGTYPITFTASNGVSPDAVQNFTLQILARTPPAFTSASSTTFAVGVAGSFTVTATGDPSPTFSEIGNLPGGVTFNSATGVLSGTPVTGAEGSYTLTFTASNGVSADATQSFILTVASYASQKGKWRWVQGSESADVDPVFGTLGTYAPDNTPGGRSGAAALTDVDGNLWLFGGSSTHWDQNNLWEFNTSSKLWRWVSGGDRGDRAGVWGTKGIYFPGYVPSTRDSALGWRGADGKFWIFGGSGFYSDDGSGLLNDLWEFDPAQNQWRWVTGSSTGICQGSNGCGQPGSYGAQAIYDVNNTPGSRVGSVGWTDTQGHLWMFGGVGRDSAGNYGALNDLWEFDPAIDQWRWVAGSSTINQAGVYGTAGIYSPANFPGARHGALIWKNADSVWLFGGGGYALGTSGVLNDLWEFNSSSRQWRWVSGSTSANQSGRYGSLGIYDSANMPGARSYTVGWKDAKGNLWLLGGAGQDSAGQGGVLNDLWEFSPRSSQWRWLSGATICNRPGIYGTLGEYGPDNTPGAREAAVAGTDANGDFWLFGGAGYDTTSVGGLLNDVWQFSPTVEFADEAPAITSAASATFKVGVAGSFTVTATGNPAPAFSESGALPDGVTFNNATGVLSGTPAAGTQGTYPITFTATNGVNPDATQNFTLTVNPADTLAPTVSVQPSASAINQNDALTVTVSVTGSKGTPTGTVTVSGGGYASAATALATGSASIPIPGNSLNVGSVTLTATYSGDANYAKATGTASITVNAILAQPVIAWPAPAAITYGTALSSAQLNATADVSGSFTYTPAAGTVLSAGTHTLSVEFTPADASRYASASKTVSLTVNQATPALTWPAPSPISSGTALSSLQLNATASVPGTFVYDPLAGTVLDVGVHTLSVEFTPTDSVNYTNASKTVSITVNAVVGPAVPQITSLTPALIKAGSSGFNLLIAGTNFETNSTVQWKGAERTTTAVNGALQVAITAADVASTGMAAVTVSNPSTGKVSPSFTFVIDSPAGSQGAFSVSSSAVTVDVAHGQSAQVPITISGVAAGSSIAVTCQNMPSGATCSYSNSTLTITAGSTTPQGSYQIVATFTITQQITARNAQIAGDLTLWAGLLGIPLCTFWIPSRLRKRLWNCCILFGGLALMLALISCGGGSGKSPKTQSVTTSSSVAITMHVN